MENSMPNTKSHKKNLIPKRSNLFYKGFHYFYENRPIQFPYGERSITDPISIDLSSQESKDRLSRSNKPSKNDCAKINQNGYISETLKRKKTDLNTFDTKESKINHSSQRKSSKAVITLINPKKKILKRINDEANFKNKGRNLITKYFEVNFLKCFDYNFNLEQVNSRNNDIFYENIENSNITNNNINNNIPQHIVISFDTDGTISIEKENNVKFYEGTKNCTIFSTSQQTFKDLNIEKCKRIHNAEFSLNEKKIKVAPHESSKNLEQDMITIIKNNISITVITLNNVQPESIINALQIKTAFNHDLIENYDTIMGVKNINLKNEGNIDVGTSEYILLFPEVPVIKSTNILVHNLQNYVTENNCTNKSEIKSVKGLTIDNCDYKNDSLSESDITNRNSMEINQANELNPDLFENASTDKVDVNFQSKDICAILLIESNIQSSYNTEDYTELTDNSLSTNVPLKVKDDNSVIVDNATFENEMERTLIKINLKLGNEVISNNEEKVKSSIKMKLINDESDLICLKNKKLQNENKMKEENYYSRLEDQRNVTDVIPEMIFSENTLAEKFNDNDNIIPKVNSDHLNSKTSEKEKLNNTIISSMQIKVLKENRNENEINELCKDNLIENNIQCTIYSGTSKNEDLNFDKSDTSQLKMGTINDENFKGIMISGLFTDDRNYPKGHRDQIIINIAMDNKEEMNIESMNDKQNKIIKYDNKIIKSHLNNISITLEKVSFDILENLNAEYNLIMEEINEDTITDTLLRLSIKNLLNDQDIENDDNQGTERNGEKDSSLLSKVTIENKINDELKNKNVMKDNISYTETILASDNEFNLVYEDLITKIISNDKSFNDEKQSESKEGINIPLKENNIHEKISDIDKESIMKVNTFPSTKRFFMESSFTKSVVEENETLKFDINEPVFLSKESIQIETLNKRDSERNPSGEIHISNSITVTALKVEKALLNNKPKRSSEQTLLKLENVINADLCDNKISQSKCNVSIVTDDMSLETLSMNIITDDTLKNKVASEIFFQVVSEDLNFLVNITESKHTDNISLKSEKMVDNVETKEIILTEKNTVIMHESVDSSQHDSVVVVTLKNLEVVQQNSFNKINSSDFNNTSMQNTYNRNMLSENVFTADTAVKVIVGALQNEDHLQRKESNIENISVNLSTLKNLDSEVKQEELLLSTESKFSQKRKPTFLRDDNQENLNLINNEPYFELGNTIIQKIYSKNESIIECEITNDDAINNKICYLKTKITLSTENISSSKEMDKPISELEKENSAVMEKEILASKISLNDKCNFDIENNILCEKENEMLDCTIKAISEEIEKDLCNRCLSPTITESCKTEDPASQSGKSNNEDTPEHNDDVFDVPIINFTSHSCFNSKFPVKIGHHEEHSNIQLLESLDPNNKYIITNTSWKRSELILPKRIQKQTSKLCLATNKICVIIYSEILKNTINIIIKDYICNNRYLNTKIYDQDLSIPRISNKDLKPPNPVAVHHTFYCQVPPYCNNGCIPNPYGYTKQRKCCMTTFQHCCQNACSINNQIEKEFVIPSDGIFGRDPNESKFLNFCCNQCHHWISLTDRKKHLKICINNNMIDEPIEEPCKLKQNSSSLKRMPGTVCYICGGRFTQNSINIHQKSCLNKWLHVNDKLDKRNRRPAPEKPEIKDGDIVERVNEQIALGNVHYSSGDAINDLLYIASRKNDINF